MKLFNWFKKDKEPEKDRKNYSWKIMESISEIEDIIKSSEDKLSVIFKHSPRCGVSRMALNAFERNLQVEEEEIELFFVDVVNQREISTELAHQFQVQHESPQLLLIKSGKCVHHGSHHQISAEIIKDFI